MQSKKVLRKSSVMDIEPEEIRVPITAEHRNEIIRILQGEMGEETILVVKPPRRSLTLDREDVRFMRAVGIKVD
jgi:hypothetical protein